MNRYTLRAQPTGGGHQTTTHLSSWEEGGGASPSQQMKRVMVMFWESSRWDFANGPHLTFPGERCVISTAPVCVCFCSFPKRDCCGLTDNAVHSLPSRESVEMQCIIAWQPLPLAPRPRITSIGHGLPSPDIVWWYHKFRSACR